MDTATRDRNIATWLGDAPQPVRDTTNQLLERIALLRTEQIIYPAQDDILNALAYTPADQVKVVILGQDPYHGPNQARDCRSRSPRRKQAAREPTQHLQGTQSRSGLSHSRHGGLTPWAQQGVLLLNTTLTVREHAANSHAKLGWSTLTDYVIERCCQLPQPVVFLTWGLLCPADGRRQARRNWCGQGNRQVLPGIYAPLAAFGQPCHGRTPRLYGVASLLRCQSATRTARLDPRQLDLPRLKIDIPKTRPTAILPSGAFCYSGQINWVRPASPPSMSRLCPVINRLVTPTK